ncbi:AAEL004403-PA [Aedes aegypti]|uniref:AAEL004403-PA n=1 Tax=Aedes aegypti TaxID=7159 RepID=Q17CX1_AEDAE|nr:AAEL004403-PA [Aedes aegypti]
MILDRLNSVYRLVNSQIDVTRWLCSTFGHNPPHQKNSTPPPDSHVHNETSNHNFMDQIENLQFNFTREFNDFGDASINNTGNNRSSSPPSILTSSKSGHSTEVVVPSSIPISAITTVQSFVENSRALTNVANTDVTTQATTSATMPATATESTAAYPTSTVIIDSAATVQATVTKPTTATAPNVTTSTTMPTATIALTLPKTATATVTTSTTATAMHATTSKTNAPPAASVTRSSGKNACTQTIPYPTTHIAPPVSARANTLPSHQPARPTSSTTPSVSTNYPTSVPVLAIAPPSSNSSANDTWYYVTRFQPNETVQNIVAYISHKANCKPEHIRCLKLTRQINSESLTFVSFKVSVPKSIEELISATEFWPIGITVSPFLERRSNIYRRKKPFSPVLSRLVPRQMRGAQLNPPANVPTSTLLRAVPQHYFNSNKVQPRMPPPPRRFQSSLV